MRWAPELLIGSPFRVSLEEGHSAVVFHVPTRLKMNGSLVLIPMSFAKQTFAKKTLWSGGRGRRS